MKGQDHFDTETLKLFSRGLYRVEYIKQLKYPFEKGNLDEKVNRNKVENGTYINHQYFIWV